MNYIKAGQLYKHTPTGIVRRVVLADNNRVTFKEDATSCYSHCSIKDFKKFWIPYTPKEEKVSHSSNYTNTQDMIDIKNIEGKYYQHTPTGKIKKVVCVSDNYIILRNNFNYSRCLIKDFLKYWKPYEAPNDKAHDDKVNHPSHYTWLKEKAGIEVIDITRWLPADISNAVKYLLRQGHKHEEGMSNNQKAIEDCKKAIWYINDYINNVLKK
jgi:hypothetical protein